MRNGLLRFHEPPRDGPAHGIERQHVKRNIFIERPYRARGTWSWSSAWNWSRGARSGDGCPGRTARGHHVDRMDTAVGARPLNVRQVDAGFEGDAPRQWAYGHPIRQLRRAKISLRRFHFVEGVELNRLLLPHSRRRDG